MLAILLPLLLSTALQEGDHWISERTLHYVQDVDHIDTTVVDRLSYEVKQATPELTAIACETFRKQSPPEKPVRQLTAFKPGGILISKEDEPDSDIERVNRIKWTATEARLGIEWSRNWPACSNLLEAKVIVKPTARSVDDTTLSVTYKEGMVTKCVGTIKVLNKVRIIEDLSPTINAATIPGAKLPGSILVTEKLKEVHLAG